MKTKYVVKLMPEERIQLKSLGRKGKHAASKILHAKILLEADVGEASYEKKSDAQIAILLDIGIRTVERVRQRFVEEGLESALSRKPSHTRRKRKMGGDEEAHLIAICCSSPPEGRNRWTLKLLAGRLIEMEIMESISPATVGRVLKKMKLNPGKKKNGVFPPR